jgi:hypothetical protein
MEYIFNKQIACIQFNMPNIYSIQQITKYIYIFNKFCTSACQRIKRQPRSQGFLWGNTKIKWWEQDNNHWQQLTLSEIEGAVERGIRRGISAARMDNNESKQTLLALLFNIMIIDQDIEYHWKYKKGHVHI